MTEHEGEHAEAHDHFDAEPTRELSEGEPQSPMWLPALGVALFTLAGIYLLIGGDDETGEAATPMATPPTAAVSGKVAGGGLPPAATRFKVMPKASGQAKPPQRPPVRPVRPKPAVPAKPKDPHAGHNHP